MAETRRGGLRRDLVLVADMIEPRSRVLDVGCEDGVLLAYLDREREVDGRGIELSMDGVNACVAAGLSVIQGDADTDLKNYPDNGFDYVILSQTLQATRAPREVLRHLVRIGRSAIVSFPNFGYWRVRWQLAARGRMPVSPTLPHEWYETPNIHLCTIRDFVGLCDALGIAIRRAIALDGAGRAHSVVRGTRLANLLGEQAVFLLARG